MYKQKIGVAHGRFQPFHLDHLKYVLAAASHCDHIIVGITNPDPTLTKTDITDVQRSNLSSNPLNYYERLLIVRESLLEANIRYERFDIVPFPINEPKLIKYYTPVQATYYLTIYDEWGRRKLELLKSLGLDVIVLWEKQREEKGITGSGIRQRMAQGLPWEHLVPSAAARTIKELGLETRICESSYLSKEFTNNGN